MRAAQPVSAKRLFDILVASVGLLLFAPLLLLIAVLILLEDGGPVIFTQQRIGRHLRPFTLLKLRSMRDGQVTRIGGWLRRSGLDESLQFINVLQGSMSLVGPRPLTLEDAERLNLHRDSLIRLTQRPGITGMAQLYAGGGLRVTQLLERRYFEQQSLHLDLIILLLSLMVNLFGKRRVRKWLRELRLRSRRSRLLRI